MPFVIVFVAGGTGALVRYLVSLWVGSLWEGSFPLGTFIINLAGCFGIGFLAGFSERIPIAANLRLLLQTGFLGGFTTFSAFGLETFQLFRRGELMTATGNLLGSNLLGVGFVFAGYFLSRGIFAPSSKV